ncbi:MULTISPECIES: DUF1772 domain-containing protein [unclassified Mesorhizobium]|uniref:DUF1772 domain-containing protein n=1 Tax=unclassified Mesorhizobium TaxID=325217 RepID=UPI0019264B43|nr:MULTISPECIES: DUF1772 domain-containing protein [unclassified Mesorhizobium]
MAALVILTATVAALSLGPSFAHVLEAMPRLAVWSPELWREATVFNGQFQLFAPVGAVLDIAAILCPAVLAFLIWGDRPASTFALAAAVLYAAALATWFAWVRPANNLLATWQPGPIPADFEEIRLRWETGHMAVAALKLGGFVSIALSMASATRRAAG